MSFYIVHESQLESVLGIKIDDLYVVDGKPLYKCPGKTVQKTKDSCAICLKKFKKGKSCLELDCKHVYHKKCIEQWKETCSFWNIPLKCPLCKQKIE